MTKLKPCPFCGGKAEAVELDDEMMGEILCFRCDIGMSASAVGNLVKAWNTRIPPGEDTTPAGTAIVDAAKKLLIHWTAYKKVTGTYEEAYYRLAKYAYPEWEKLRQAIHGDEV